MKRLKLNKNLSLVYGDQYDGLPIYNSPEGLVREYLDRTIGVLDNALNDYANVYAFRVDVNFPKAWLVSEDQASMYISSFIRNLRYQIRTHNELIKYPTVLRYIATREYTQEGRIHYHFMFFVNKNSYHTLGRYDLNHDNLYTRLVKSYASALKIEPCEAVGLVHIPMHAGAHFKRKDAGSIGSAVYRASYLCKAYSKQYGNRKHSFLSSRG
jgi:hypothetical protein